MPAARTSNFAKLQKIRRVIARARASNPLDQANMSSPPTVTTAFDGALSTFFNVDDLINSGKKIGNLLGGNPYDVGTVSGALHGWGAYPFSITGTKQQKDVSFEFFSDAPKLMIRGNQGTWRVEINSQFLAAVGNATVAGGGEQQLVLDWTAVRATRRYIVHMPGAGYISRIGVDALSRVWAPSLDDEVRVAWLGDSYVDGVGATFNDKSVAPIASYLLGMKDHWMFSAQGTGYLAVGAYNTFRGRATDIIASAPDIIIIPGGTNDTAGAGLTAEILLLLQTLRAGLAGTPIVVLGPWPKATGPSANILSVESNAQSAVTSFADPLCAFVAVAADATGAWNFGTGFSGATNSSGNSDVYIGVDGAHPVDAGHEYLGRRTADAVRSALLAMTGA